MSMELVKYNKARFEKNSLVIEDDITIDEWKGLGQSLKQVEGSVQFWIGDWARYGDKRGFTGNYTDPKVYDELEDLTGLTRQTIKDYKSVAERTSSLRNDDLTFNHHKEVAKLEPEQQSEFLQKAVDENLSVRDLRKEINYSEKEFKIRKIPDGVYRVIYVDPPWSYNDKQNTDMLGGAEKHYPSMSIEELCEMELPKMPNDAVLFMWATSPLLEEAFKVIKAWGFSYKTSFVWDKVKHNMGHYNSVRHELLLVCTKGSCTPDNVKLFDSVQTIERSDKHSEKPHEFYNIIETLYEGNKIELFARNKREGWDGFGNEI